MYRFWNIYIYICFFLYIYINKNKIIKCIYIYVLSTIWFFILGGVNDENTQRYKYIKPDKFDLGLAQCRKYWSSLPLVPLQTGLFLPQSWFSGSNGCISNMIVSFHLGDPFSTKPWLWEKRVDRMFQEFLLAKETLPVENSRYSQVLA